MLFKKSKAIIAAALSAAMVTNAMVATVASAAGDVAGTRTKAEAFGDDTYAERFLSLYDDVMTNGVDNGYMSSNGASSSSFGIPYHAVEEVIIEAPDYGHETTSEAMSYLVWVAAMRDNIAKNHTDLVDEGTLEYTADLAKAWTTMENMIPTVQDNFWSGGAGVSAQYCGEYDNPEDCPDKHAAESWKTASNPIHGYFTSAYSSDKGLYLMHWLADVDNWYGFGTGTNFTFINTFQRGEQESCWETVPHPCVEEKKYGNPQKGLKGIFNRDEQVTNQYAYTNAPDAEDRAIQGVYDANRWGVGDSSVSAKAAKMGDELRNNMFDKYYQAIALDNSSWTNGNAGYDSAHYLMNWYTSWGGALASSGQNWVWQIGCSHSHEFYQNPLAAFALIQDADLKSGMKAQGAVTDYTTSLERQMEFYLWLQSSDGPIAGGATNSYHGRYDAYPAGVSTFYDMMYTEHPVYADPGSNHWIGNQVWAVQRLAELYYWVKTEGDTTGVAPGGMKLEDALKQILDKWVEWFLNNTVLTDDGDFYIPATLNWSGQPDTWNGVSTGNSGLTCTVTAYGNADFGCISSLANTLIYYAKANGATAEDAAKEYAGIGSKAVAGLNDNVTAGSGAGVDKSTMAGASLYLAQQLLDRQWDIGRDDIGLTRTDYNGSLARFFSQPVHIPSSYTGTMPNNDSLVSGITFLDIRSMYLSQDNCKGAPTSEEAIALVQELQAAYEKDVAAGAEWSGSYSASTDQGKAELAGFTNVGSVELQYHRFWHAGDILMALGVMAELYPDLEPTIQYGEEAPTDILYGDTEVDGDVDIMDVIHLSQSFMGAAELTAAGAANADVDLSGTVTPSDTMYIAQSLVKLVTLPVEG